MFMLGDCLGLAGILFWKKMFYILCLSSIAERNQEEKVGGYAGKTWWSDSKIFHPLLSLISEQHASIMWVWGKHFHLLNILLLTGVVCDVGFYLDARRRMQFSSKKEKKSINSLNLTLIISVMRV